MADIVWSQGYSPAEAERGKFVAIDNTTITDYPSSGRGKYALLTHCISPVKLTLPDSLWIGSSNTSAGDIITYSNTPSLREIQIQNKTTGSIFFFPSATDYSNAVNLGLEISSNNSYFQAKDFKDGITIASVSGGDIRVIGHYIG